MIFNRKDLENRKKVLEATKEQMGINHQYKESKYQNKMVELINRFRMAETLEEKENIADEMVELRGNIPTEIQMELNSLRSPKR